MTAALLREVDLFLFGSFFSVADADADNYEFDFLLLRDVLLFRFINYEFYLLFENRGLRNVNDPSSSYELIVNCIWSFCLAPVL